MNCDSRRRSDSETTVSLLLRTNGLIPPHWYEVEVLGQSPKLPSALSPPPLDAGHRRSV